MTLPKPCLGCGEPSETTRCEHCKPEPKPDLRLSPRARGYTQSWRLLSERARRLQPWCTDCGTDNDLTCDHSPEAWERHNNGLPIRLVDIDVVCRSCNSRRGRARPWGEDPPEGQADPRGKAPKRSDTPRGFL